MLLEDLATTLSLALEGRLLAKQSIERGTYLNNLLNSSDIAVMVIELTTPGKPVITLVNQRFRELFGISTGEAGPAAARRRDDGLAPTRAARLGCAGEDPRRPAGRAVVGAHR